MRDMVAVRSAPGSCPGGSSDIPIQEFSFPIHAGVGAPVPSKITRVGEGFAAKPTLEG